MKYLPLSTIKGGISMGKKITEKVTWVGKVDWELKQFLLH
jgi:hypothetical protein